jgi:hypothetical protein
MSREEGLLTEAVNLLKSMDLRRLNGGDTEAGGMNNLNGHRDGKGRFTLGNPGGPSRPRRAVELNYLATLADAVPKRRWRKIITRAVRDAEAGDAKARRWLAEYLLGRRAEPLTTLAASELAGTLDEEILAQAAGLRGSVFRKKVMNRASSYPDLNPGRPSGGGNVGGGPRDLHVDLEAR